jgi:hypothetical protein
MGSTSIASASAQAHILRKIIPYLFEICGVASRCARGGIGMRPLLDYVELIADGDLVQQRRRSLQDIASRRARRVKRAERPREFYIYHAK